MGGSPVSSATSALFTHADADIDGAVINTKLPSLNTPLVKNALDRTFDFNIIIGINLLLKFYFRHLSPIRRALDSFGPRANRNHR